MHEPADAAGAGQRERCRRGGRVHHPVQESSLGRRHGWLRSHSRGGGCVLRGEETGQRGGREADGTWREQRGARTVGQRGRKR